MHLIQQIGSYAGLAAIPGLAVLSALYFSQARDVKRLREWAGRAPERAAEQAVGGRVVAQPQQTAAGPSQAGAAGPAAKPAAAGAATPAGAAGAAAAPAAAGTSAAAAGATPAGATAKAGIATPSTAPAAATPAGQAAGASKAPALAAPAAAAAASASAGSAGSGSGGGATGTVTRTGRPPAVGGVRPGAPAVRRPAPRAPGSQTSILTAAKAPRESWYRRLPAGRYVALIVAGVLVIGGGVAFGITQLASNGSSGSSAGSPAKKAGSSGGGGGGSTKKQHAAPAIAPSSITVSVVNGTTIANLARDTATKLRALGFQTGNVVTGTGPLAAAESVVKYKPGAADQAKLVASKLHITQRQPADADAITQGGAATVIVVLGADQAPGG